jgi:4-nitrophenyl phosphatase
MCGVNSAGGRLTARTIVFDLDGVIYRGERVIPGVPAAIARLQERAKILFLTNNSTRSRADCVRHLASLGISAKAPDVMTSSFGCARYIKENHGIGCKVFLIGEQGLRDELEAEAKVRFVESGAEIVVVGLDRQVDYRKLDLGLRNLQGGAVFLVANSDPTYPAEQGFSPGSGAIAASLICASGRKPDTVIGKPSSYLIEKLLRMHRAKPASAVFVGDRLDTDMRLANRMGMKSVLVLTGVTRAADVRSAPASDRPDAVIGSAAELESLLGAC